MTVALQQLSAALRRGETSSAALVSAALARIADPNGESARTFLKVYATAPEHARVADRLREAIVAPQPV